MSKTGKQLVVQARSWLGRKESDGSHKKIIDVYNSHKPLPRGYALSYTDAWCAAFVSACAIACDMTDIIPLECSCSKMITLFDDLGCWQERDDYVPNVGDIIFYDWEDSGNGDNSTGHDHVGIVSSVDGNSFEVIEGNKSNAVGIRKMEVNGKYIRGFGVPKYHSEGVSSYIIYTVQKGDTLRKIAKSYGLSISEIMACNIAKLSNPDIIKVGWELNIPIPIVYGKPDSEATSESLETTNYYAIGKRVMECIEDIKNLESYKKLLQVLEETGD